MDKQRLLAAAVVLFVVTACASSNGATRDVVDADEAATIVGLLNGVTVNAQLIGNTSFHLGGKAAIRYEVTNDRTEAIAIADMVPEVTYDDSEQMITVNIGSEVPGNEMLPRLIRIKPGETKVFQAGARLTTSGLTDSESSRPRYLRVRVHFLGKTEPFAELVEISEKAVADRKRADELFPLWIEHSESVTTNSVPIRWLGRESVDLNRGGF